MEEEEEQQEEEEEELGQEGLREADTSRPRVSRCSSESAVFFGCPQVEGRYNCC